MKRMTTVESRENYSELINNVAYGKTRTILTRRGRDLCAVVPLEDLVILDKYKGAK